MENKKFLIADDESRLREMLREYLAPEGYLVDEAKDGKEALELFEKNEYDLVILDVMMPKVDGWTVCREIRRSSKVPVIMLTARGEEYDKLFGFELGIDDYMVKPFSPKELLARIKAIIRRSTVTERNIDDLDHFEYKGFRIEYAARNVLISGKQVYLTPKEYELLAFFTKNPNRVFSRDQLLNEVWGYEFYGDHRTVDTHVKMLRDNLGEYRTLIVTVWGTGYKFETGAIK
jgi:DNA-binding response OmpR family regulator